MSDPDDVTPLDGEEFLAANRSNREKYREEAARKATKKAGEAGGGESDESDRVPRKLDSGAGMKTSDRSSRKLVAALAVAVVALVVSTVFFAYSYFRDNGSDVVGLSSREVEVMDMAKRYAAEFGTYDAADYGDLDRRIDAVSTQSFAKTYIESSQEARKGNAEARGVSRGEAKEAGLQSISENKAVVLVALDQTVTAPEVAAQVPEGIPYQSRVKVTLVRQDGRWLLDNLEPV